MVACGGLRKCGEGFELGAGCAGVNGFCGEAHTIEKIGGAGCRDESAGCIGQHDFAVRAVLQLPSAGPPKPAAPATQPGPGAANIFPTADPVATVAVPGK